MNAGSSTKHADVIAAWRSLPPDERVGGLAGFTRWTASVLPSSMVARFLDLPQGFVDEVLDG